MHVDVWLQFYNNERYHSDRDCFGKTPIQTWKESLHLAKDVILDAINEHFVCLYFVERRGNCFCQGEAFQ